MVQKCVNLSVATTTPNVVVEDFEVYNPGTTTPVSIINVGDHFDMVIYISNTGGAAAGVVVQVKIGSDIIASGVYDIGQYSPSSPMTVTFPDRFFDEVGSYTLCGVTSGSGITTTQDCKTLQVVGEYRLEITQAPLISPQSVQLGNPVSITVYYRNTGIITLPANKGRITLTAGSQTIDQRLVQELSPGASGSFTMSWTAGSAGSFTVCAAVSYV
jgi:hypothetical protein